MKIGGDAVRQIAGRSAICGAIVVIVYGLIAPRQLVSTSGSASPFDAISNAMLFELVKQFAIAGVAGLVVAVASYRGHFHRSNDQKASVREQVSIGWRILPPAFFAFLAGGFLIVFKPMTDLFNIVDTRGGRGAAVIEISPLRVALAVDAVILWAWISLLIGMAVAAQRGSLARANGDEAAPKIASR